LPWTTPVPILVLLAQAVFLLERGHADRQTHKVKNVTDHPSHGSATAGMMPAAAWEMNTNYNELTIKAQINKMLLSYPDHSKLLTRRLQGNRFYWHMMLGASGLY